MTSHEYIEREAVKKVFEDFGKPIVMAPGFAARQIDAMSAADVAPVVWCKDCKHITPVEGGLPLCTLHNIARAYNDFCSDGDRVGE